VDQAKPPENLVAVYDLSRGHNVWSDWRKSAMLVKHLAWRHLAARYRGSSLGFAWSLITPLSLMGVYTFVFRYIFQATTPGVPFPVFMLTGILAWNFFNAAVLHAAVSLVNGANLINKASFPRIALPLSAIVANGVNYVVALPIVVIFNAMFGILPTSSLILLPLALILILMLSVGVGALLSVLMPFFNDLQHLIEVAFSMWFFLTPVVYPLNQVPERIVPIYELNPMVGIIGLIHSAFLGQPFSPRSLLISVIGSTILFCLGLAVFKRRAMYCTEV
jgi:ABC-type polysaccharide/polyol phosphate export permease